MSHCPHCQASVPDDIGLVVCRQCGESFMVGLDGDVSVGQQETESSLDFEASSDAPLGGELEFSESYTESPASAESTGSPVAFEEFLMSEELVEEVPSGQEPPPPPTQRESLLPTFEEENLEYSEGEAFDDQGDAGLSPEPLQTEQNLNEVADFGNSNTSTWVEGNIKYKIKVSSIDTSEDRQKIKEILEDPRLSWNAAEIMMTITDGELTLSEVNPIKASVVLQQLRSVDVGVTWEQYVLQQSE